MGGRRNGGYGGDSSSGEEDGDAQWRAAIDSVAVSSVFISSLTNGLPATSTTTASNSDDDSELNLGAQAPKQYQIKAQKLLDNILETTLEVVEHPNVVPCDDDSKSSEGGIRLFKNAPMGVVFDHVDELQRPTKRPKILPGKEINEKSKKQLRSVAVEGEDIITAAKRACEKSIARLEAKEAAVKAAAKREEERVAEMKKIYIYIYSFKEDSRELSQSQELDTPRQLTIFSPSRDLSLRRLSAVAPPSGHRRAPQQSDEGSVPRQRCSPVFLRRCRDRGFGSFEVIRAAVQHGKRNSWTFLVGVFV